MEDCWSVYLDTLHFFKMLQINLDYLMRIAHGPVGEVLDELVPELHFLPEGQIVSSLHHRVNQLT